MQSLLERHEAYLADSERDRADLISRIGQLEMDKKELEAENARKIEENRALLDQLETLNATVSDSDTHIKMLEATLQSSQQIIRRLEGAEERAEDMERHLAALEAEQANLQNSLVTSESEARSAVQRWRRAERGIADLQYQLEKMEQEAREEQERHLEVIGRMERQRAVDKELNTAAGRLKGAAASKSLRETRPEGNGVVTHFVRDLLQDNANLQLGIAELREMLMNSNDEIQLLRDQLMFHQPLVENNASAASTLRAELESDSLTDRPETRESAAALDTLLDSDASISLSTPATPQPGRHRSTPSQELHIHHHYHVSNKKAETKKPKKKRVGLNANVFTPPGSSTPLSRRSSTVPFQQDIFLPTPGSSPLPQSYHRNRDSISTAMSGPSNRWSVFSDQPSEFTMSSVPSSPRTDPRHSILDQTLLSEMSLSPTSSVDPLSPTWQSRSRTPGLDDSLSCGFPPPLALPASADQPQLPEPIIEADEADSLPDDEPLSADDNKSDTSVSEDIPDFTSNATGTADESAPSEATTPTLTQPTPIAGCDALPRDNILSSAADGKDATDPFDLASRARRPLRRAVSHESIISLQGGLDIHTLKTRPSQLLLRPLGTAMADTGLSSITASPVIARSSPATLKSNNMLRDSLSLGLPTSRATARVVSSPLAPTVSASMALPTSSAAASLAGARGLGKLVAWRPWGSGASSTATASAATASLSASAAAASVPTVRAAMPAAVSTTTVVAVATSSAAATDSAATVTPEEHATADNTSAASTPPAAPSSSSSSTTAVAVPQGTASSSSTPRKSKPNGGPSAAAKSIYDLNQLRSPGINQPGAIPGFFEYWAAHQRRGVPSKVQADIIDEEALREGLLGP